MSTKSNPRIEVRRVDTGEVVKVIPLEAASARNVERILMGLLRQMDQEHFYAVEVDCP